MPDFLAGSSSETESAMPLQSPLSVTSSTSTHPSEVFATATLIAAVFCSFWILRPVTGWRLVCPELSVSVTLPMLSVLSTLHSLISPTPG